MILWTWLVVENEKDSIYVIEKGKEMNTWYCTYLWFYPSTDQYRQESTPPVKDIVYVLFSSIFIEPVH